MQTKMSDIYQQKYQYNLIHVSKSVRLYNPGPINVSDDTFNAMGAAMIGHRGNDFVKLYEDIHPKLQALFGTEGPVYLSTSSAWGVMEAAVRNLTQKKF